MNSLLSKNFFVRRLDLLDITDGAIDLYYAKDLGVLVRRKPGWYFSNDRRWRMVGVVPNAELCQPTVGPFPTATKAFAASKL